MGKTRINEKQLVRGYQAITEAKLKGENKKIERIKGRIKSVKEM